MTLEELTTLERLNRAFEESAKISNWKDTTQRYRANLLVNNLQLQEDLRNGKYTVSPTVDFRIYERGKERCIQAPAMRDRIVQKVLCQDILLPNLTKSLIYDNYASLKGRGTSFARKRVDVMLHNFIRKHGNEGYILQIDIRKYFDSIDHDVLKQLVHEKIHESPEVMSLIDYIIDTSSNSNKGLNLGSEAPQTLAIFYLSRVDQYVKSVCGMKYYGRYMDDIFVIHDDKEVLKRLLAEIKMQLEFLKLDVNEKKTHITKLSHGFTFMQIKYDIRGNKVIKRPTHKKIVRERRRLKKFRKKYDSGRMDLLQIQNCYMSWRGNIIRDCNACNGSIRSLDRLYDSLFPIREEHKRQPRRLLINGVFREFFNTTTT